MPRFLCFSSGEAVLSRKCRKTAVFQGFPLLFPLFGGTFPVFPCFSGLHLTICPFSLLWPVFSPSAAFSLAFCALALLLPCFPFCDLFFRPLRRFSLLFVLSSCFCPAFPSVARFSAPFGVFPCFPRSHPAFTLLFLLWPVFPPSAALFLAFRALALLSPRFPFCDLFFALCGAFPCFPRSHLAFAPLFLLWPVFPSSARLFFIFLAFLPLLPSVFCRSLLFSAPVALFRFTAASFPLFLGFSRIFAFSGRFRAFRPAIANTRRSDGIPPAAGRILTHDAKKQKPPGQNAPAAGDIERMQLYSLLRDTELSFCLVNADCEGTLAVIHPCDRLRQQRNTRCCSSARPTPTAKERTPPPFYATNQQQRNTRGFPSARRSPTLRCLRDSPARLRRRSSRRRPRRAAAACRRGVSSTRQGCR